MVYQGRSLLSATILRRFYSTGVCVDRGAMVPCVLPGLHASEGQPNWITDLTIPSNVKLEPYGDPQYVKMIQAMQVKLKEYANQNQGR